MLSKFKSILFKIYIYVQKKSFTRVSLEKREKQKKTHTQQKKAIKCCRQTEKCGRKERKFV